MVLSKFREVGVRRVVLMMVAFAHCLLSLQVSAQLGGSFPGSLSFTCSRTGWSHLGLAAWSVRDRYRTVGHPSGVQLCPAR